MMRSMSVAMGALKNHQTYMDVISSNIANINTVGYKASRVSFNELLSQTIRGASAATTTTGGLNPIQISLGMTLAGVDTLFTQGSSEETGKSTDLAIQGDGFFVLDSGAGNVYTRDGNLDVGVDGTLLNLATGYKVLGWTADAAGNVDTTGALTSIVIPYGQNMAAATTEAVLSGNLEAGADSGSASSVSTVSNAQTDGASNFGTSSTISQAAGESDSGEYFVEIGTGTNANKFRLVDSDGNAVSISSTADGTGSATSGWISLGTSQSTWDTGRGLTISFTDASADGDYAQATYDASAGVQAASTTYTASTEAATSSVTLGVYDSLGNLHNIDLTFTRTSNTNEWALSSATSDSGTSVSLTGTPITFNSDGSYSSSNPAVSLTMTYSNGAESPATVSVDLEKLTQLEGSSSISMSSQDGLAPGSLTSFSVGSSGEVIGVFSNGLNRVLGQISLAKFANSGGLTKIGQSLYSPSANSGTAQIGVAGENGLGSVSAGYLEMSNVELAQQFTNMIVAERGFQANSRMITSSDEMLQDLVNLKR